MSEGKQEPRLNYVRVIMSEEVESDVELIFDEIIVQMDKKKVSAQVKRAFINAYFHTREKGREKLMELFTSWVNLQRKKIK